MRNLFQWRRPKRCAIYVRCATSADVAAVSVQSQLRACRKYIARRRGWACSATYLDIGHAGANTARPQLQLLFDAIRAAQLDVLVVFQADRLARGYLDFVGIMEFLEEHGTKFVSVVHHIDTSTKVGRRQLQLVMSFKGLERAMTLFETHFNHPPWTGSDEGLV